MKLKVIFSVILAMVMQGTKAQDSVFCYTHQDVTLYYTIDSEGDAMLVSPIWPHFDRDNNESWTGYTKPQGEVVVPDSVPFDGRSHAVTRVDDKALYRCDKVTSVKLPNTITTIGKWAFNQCSSLESVFLGQGIDTIGYCAFRECVNLCSINFPSSLKVIDDFAFQYDGRLSIDLVLPEGFTSLGVVAFGDCVNLTSVSLPGTMKEVPPEVFWGCSSLSYVIIAEGITKIGESAFISCPSLHKLTLPSTLECIDDSVFHEGTPIDTLVLRSGVPPTAGNGVFADYHTVIIVPQGTIGAYRQHRVWTLFPNIIENETSAIRTMQHNTPTDIYYDMQGHRLNSRPQGMGIYIRNGKKIIMATAAHHTNIAVTIKKQI